MHSRHFASGLLLALGGCDPALDAHIEPHSRADSVVIHAFVALDSTTGGASLYEIVVSRCDGPSATRDTTWASAGAKVSTHGLRILVPSFRTASCLALSGRSGTPPPGWRQAAMSYVLAA